jgi:DNA-binding NtrC family response regulator
MSREIVGSSQWAKTLRQQIASVASRPSTVLVTGPSGTGKELIARAVHEQSDRANKPFIPIDCASVTGTLFASHMFGHVKGAFTGAISDTLGCFRAASGGTVFLDEIGEMELGLQAKLLRVLQERVVVPVGSHKELPVDIRLIAATNADLENAVQDGRFRRDLFYRLAVVPIRTIPLGERPEDIPTIADHILGRLSDRQHVPRKALAPEAMALLLSHSWPGNVRELENVLENAAYASDATVMTCEDLMVHSAFVPSKTNAPPPAPAPEPAHAVTKINQVSASHEQRIPYPHNPSDDSWMTLNALERQHIQESLQKTNFNQSAAARLLGIPRSVLYRRIAKHGIVLPGRSPAEEDQES